jgi:HNH endonuclease
MIARGPLSEKRYAHGRVRKPMRVHRWVWEQVNGPIPDGRCVLHRCDNPPCFRLDHLWLGSKADNAADRDTKGRTGSRSPFTAEQIAEIRARLDAGELGVDLAGEYRVSESTISNYRLGRTKGRRTSARS